MAKKPPFLWNQRWLRRLAVILSSFVCIAVFYHVVSLSSLSKNTTFEAIHRKSSEPNKTSDPFKEALHRQEHIKLLMRRNRILQHILKLNQWPLRELLELPEESEPSHSGTSDTPKPASTHTIPFRISPLLFNYAQYANGIPLPDTADLFLKTPAKSANLYCKPVVPGLTPFRYNYLLDQRFMLVFNLFNSEDILPDFLASLLLFISKLNPSNLHVSIYENGSRDQTKTMLQSLRVYLRGLAVNHSVALDDSGRPAHFHRIEYLAQVRNKAMAPLWSTQAQLRALYSNSTTHFYDERFDPATGKPVVYGPGEPPVVDKIIFLNDVMFCPEELMELVHQSFLQSADISCGMDYARSALPVFYDYWVARDKHGEKWFNLPYDKILKDGDTDQENLVNKQLPFQAFCCWNGGAVLNPLPFTHYNVRFRRGNKYPGECSASECNVMCRDFLRHGFNRTIAVPKFKVAYEHPTFRSLKATDSNFVKRFSTFLRLSPADDQLISFVPTPKKVFCWPMYHNDSHGPDGAIFWEDLSNVQNETAAIVKPPQQLFSVPL